MNRFYKILFSFGILFLLASVLSFWGCGPGNLPSQPPPAPIPTFTSIPASTPVFLQGTPTPSANCSAPPALALLTGGGDPSGCFPPVPVIAIITVTPVPTATPSWSGSLPPHPNGMFVLQGLADWNNYLLTSYFPSATLAPPFNTATQRLAVLAYELSNTGYANIVQVCDDGTAIHVVVGYYSGGGAEPISNCWSEAVQAAVIPNNGEPVIWDTFDVMCEACAKAPPGHRLGP